MLITEVEITYLNPVPVNDRVRVTDPELVHRLFMNVWPSFGYREYFYIMLLDRGNNLLGVSQLSAGGTGGCYVDLKMIFQLALKANAAGIIIAHNHPSGNLKPSPADIESTLKIFKAGNLLDITLLDHLIMSADGYLSMEGEGLIK